MMDEPFAALDFQTRVLMQQFLLEVWLEFKPTIIFVTHHIDEAVLLADRVVVMSAGPGRIIDEVRIDLPRPRRMTDARLQRLSRAADRAAGARGDARLSPGRARASRMPPEAVTVAAICRTADPSPTCSTISAPTTLRYSAAARELSGHDGA